MTAEGLQVSPAVRSADEVLAAGSHDGQHFTVTVVVPTFNEGLNIQELVARLKAATAGIEAEVVFVDDSVDDTPAVITRIAGTSRLPIRMVHRDHPSGGLGGAVIEGLRLARAPWAVVMDADLQHPPELVSTLLAAGTAENADVVVGTRYDPAGAADGLGGWYRHLVSRLSTFVAKSLFPRRLQRISDPMSGFFALRRDAVDLGSLHPMGYKIMMEIVVRGGLEAAVEVPYVFGRRLAGESKSSLREGLRFLRHLADLRFASAASRSVLFALIGLSGVLPNLAVGQALALTHAVSYGVATVVATQVAIVWNFAWLETVGGRQNSRMRFPSRLASFWAINNLDLVVRLPLSLWLVSSVAMPEAIATVTGIAVCFALRFMLIDKIVYRAMRTRTSRVLSQTPAVVRGHE